MIRIDINPIHEYDIFHASRDVYDSEFMSRGKLIALTCALLGCLLFGCMGLENKCQIFRLF